jgi:hypothetical protein
MADRSVREFSTQAPAGYVGDFLRGGIFPYAQRFLHGQFANMGAPDSSPYTYTGRRVAEFDPREKYGMEMSDAAIGSYQPYLGAQAGMIDRAASYLDPTGYKDYMSPYTDEVIDRTMGDMREQIDLQKGAARDRAVSSGAFGGSRGRIAEGEIERGGLRSMGDIAAGLRERGFGQAQKQAFQAAGGFGNLGNMYGGMASMLPQLQTGDINRTMGMGGLGRGRGQSLDDLAYQNFVGQYNLPMQTLGNVGALTASLGPMAGGYGYAGQGMPTEFPGGSAYQPSTGGIGTPGAGSYQPYPGSGLGGGAPTGYGVSTGGYNYNTYGSNMPIAHARNGGGIGSLKYRG